MPVRFQVDSDFYDHPKVIGMSDAAFALWVRAGSYSTAKLLDGFVSDDALSLFSQTQQDAAGELVRHGLWKRTRGGYQFHQWGERNLTRGRVEADREADRDRKRADRNGNRVTHTRLCNACGNAFVTHKSDAKYCSGRCRVKAHREVKQQVETEVVRSDVRPESDRNPTGIRPVSVSVSVSESVSGSGQASTAPNSRASPPTPEPPRTCPNHETHPDPPPCGRCREARLTHDAWQRHRIGASSAARSTTAHQRATANAQAIAACDLCDHAGYRNSRTCNHDPTQDQRTRTGAATARAAILSRTNNPKEPG